MALIFIERYFSDQLKANLNNVAGAHISDLCRTSGKVNPNSALRFPLQLALLISPLCLLLPLNLEKRSFNRGALIQWSIYLGAHKPDVLQQTEKRIWKAILDIVNQPSDYVAILKVLASTFPPTYIEELRNQSENVTGWFNIQSEVHSSAGSNAVQNSQECNTDDQASSSQQSESSRSQVTPISPPLDSAITHASQSKTFSLSASPLESQTNDAPDINEEANDNEEANRDVEMIDRDDRVDGDGGNGKNRVDNDKEMGEDGVSSAGEKGQVDGDGGNGGGRADNDEEMGEDGVRGVGGVGEKGQVDGDEGNGVNRAGNEEGVNKDGARDNEADPDARMDVDEVEALPRPSQPSRTKSSQLTNPSKTSSNNLVKVGRQQTKSMTSPTSPVKVQKKKRPPPAEQATSSSQVRNFPSPSGPIDSETRVNAAKIMRVLIVSKYSMLFIFNLFSMSSRKGEKRLRSKTVMQRRFIWVNP